MKKNPPEESNETHSSLETFAVDSAAYSQTEMIRITGDYDWLDSSAALQQEVDDEEDKNTVKNTPRRHKFLKFLPSKILLRRQALLVRFHQTKDFTWALMAFIMIPMGLIVPPLLIPHTHSFTYTTLLARSPVASWTVIVVLILSFGSALGFNRLLYQTRAGMCVFSCFFFIYRN